MSTITSNENSRRPKIGDAINHFTGLIREIPAIINADRIIAESIDENRGRLNASDNYTFMKNLMEHDTKINEMIRKKGLDNTECARLLACMQDPNCEIPKNFNGAAWACARPPPCRGNEKIRRTGDRDWCSGRPRDVVDMEIKATVKAIKKREREHLSNLLARPGAIMELQEAEDTIRDGVNALNMDPVLAQVEAFVGCSSATCSTLESRMLAIIEKTDPSANLSPSLLKALNSPELSVKKTAVRVPKKKPKRYNQSGTVILERPLDPKSSSVADSLEGRFRALTDIDAASSVGMDTMNEASKLMAETANVMKRNQEAMVEAMSGRLGKTTAFEATQTAVNESMQKALGTIAETMASMQREQIAARDGMTNLQRAADRTLNEESIKTKFVSILKGGPKTMAYHALMTPIRILHAVVIWPSKYFISNSFGHYFLMIWGFLMTLMILLVVMTFGLIFRKNYPDVYQSIFQVLLNIYDMGMEAGSATFLRFRPLLGEAADIIHEMSAAGISSLFNTVMQFFYEYSAVGSVIGGVKSGIGSIGSGIGSAAGSIGSGIGSAAGSIGSGIGSAWTGMFGFDGMDRPCNHDCKYGCKNQCMHDCIHDCKHIYIRKSNKHQSRKRKTHHNKKKSRGRR
jgi:hypothetical protein